MRRSLCAGSAILERKNLLKRVVDGLARLVLLFFLFGALIVLVPFFILAARRWLSRNKVAPRARLFVGRTTCIEESLEWGWAHVRLDEKLYLARSADDSDLIAGTRVDVVDTDGAMLVVQPAGPSEIATE